MFWRNIFLAKWILRHALQTFKFNYFSVGILGKRVFGFDDTSIAAGFFACSPIGIPNWRQTQIRGSTLRENQI